MAKKYRKRPRQCIMLDDVELLELIDNTPSEVVTDILAELCKYSAAERSGKKYNCKEYQYPVSISFRTLFRTVQAGIENFNSQRDKRPLGGEGVDTPEQPVDNPSEGVDQLKGIEIENDNEKEKELIGKANNQASSDFIEQLFSNKNPIQLEQKDGRVIVNSPRNKLIVLHNHMMIYGIDFTLNDMRQSLKKYKPEEIDASAKKTYEAGHWEARYLQSVLINDYGK